MASDMLTVRVARKTVEAEDICAFELRPVDAARLPAFTAGSHIEVQLPGGLTRQYSLCNDPRENERYLIGVLRDPASRGGSQAMHDRVAEGDRLQISAPKNRFALAAAPGASLLLAGGIGVTPILCMAQALSAAGAAFEMHYCARSRARAAFVDHIAAAPFAARVALHFDDEAAAQRLDLAGLLAQADPLTQLYVCGPKGFMDAVLDQARALGWPPERLHHEFFAATAQDGDDDVGFELELASSGRVVQVAKGVTIVRALADAGVEVLVSCEQGVCGTCLTRVLAGEPDHRDVYLTPAEQRSNDQMLLCCSRAKSARLVIDL